AGRVASLARFEAPVAATGAVRVGHRRAVAGAAVVAAHARRDVAGIDALARAERALQRAEGAGLVRAARGAARPLAELARLEHAVAAHRRAVVVVDRVAPAGTAAVAVHALRLRARGLALGLAGAPADQRAERASHLRAAHGARRERVARL